MMEEGTSSRNASRLFAGLVIIALGAIALLDNFGIVRIGNVWRLWPLVLIAVGIAKLLRPRGSPGRFAGTLLFALGLWLLLENLGVWPYSLGTLWPLFVLALGAFLVWGGLGHRPAGPGPDTGSRISSFSILGGTEHKSKSEDFQGGDATAILGGCKMDLRQAAIKSGEAVLDVFAMWGGVEVLVPREWNVVIKGAPILGAFEDKTDSSRRDGGPRLIIRGAAIMGGVEIKN
jgi:predicted membrane protein